MHIGLDDTDSPQKGCTTYIAALLVENLINLGCTFIDYPNLIRLNPNVPWKTRGNGALCLRITFDVTQESSIKETVIRLVENYSELEYPQTFPGVVFLKNSVPLALKNFARRAITGIVSLKEALLLAKRFHADVVGFKKGRGIIGALAAVGETLSADHTFELIAYRQPNKYGLTREIDVSSIFEMDKKTNPYTFNNVDLDKRRVLITPRGPDPILFGVRGENPEVLKEAYGLIRSLESVERWIIYRSNQGTDTHFQEINRLDRIVAYHSVVTRGIVLKKPVIIPRRHVIFTIKDAYGQVDCAAYEPTGTLCKVAKELLANDYIEVYGGVRPPELNLPLTINLEKFRPLKLEEKKIFHNPLCPKCAKRLKSKGKNKGWSCKKCGSKYLNIKKNVVTESREISSKLYIASPRSQRHLSKPFQRYGLEKKEFHSIPLIDNLYSAVFL